MNQTRWSPKKNLMTALAPKIIIIFPLINVNISRYLLIVFAIVTSTVV